MQTAQYSDPKHFNAYTGNTPPRTNVQSRASPPTINNSNNNQTAAAAAIYTDSNNENKNSQHTELNQILSQYTRGGDRRQVLRSLMDPKLLPRMHTLRSVWVEDIALAEREAAGERAVLNSVKFLQAKNLPSADDLSSNTGPIDSYFLQTLREICGHMCDMDGVDADPMAIYGGLLLRLSRTIAERDALEVITNWTCGKGELVILPLKRRHHEIRSNESSRLPIPIDVELYVESGNVHAKVTMRHELGLHLRTNLESNGCKKELSPWSALAQQQLQNNNEAMQPSSLKEMSQIQYETLTSEKFGNPKPWIYVDADVVERINFGTGSSVRMLHVNVPEDKNSGYVKKW